MGAKTNDYTMQERAASNPILLAELTKIHCQYFAAKRYYRWPKDTEGQRRGADISIQTAHCPLLHIDEKIRTKDYQDLLIEWTSCDRTQSPGWIRKADAITDVIAYVLPSSIYYIPFRMLQRYALQLCRGKQKLYAKNSGGYSSINYAVQWDELTDYGIPYRRVNRGTDKAR
jgi:hypothetical protein